MKELELSLKTEIETLIKKAMDSFNPHDIESSIEILKEAWNLLPNPKHQWWDSSFLPLKYITIVYFNAKQFENSESWAKEFLIADNFNRNYGESEFILGKINFEFNRFDEARKYFEIASDKSKDARGKSRVWVGEKDIKYKNFYDK